MTAARMRCDLPRRGEGLGWEYVYVCIDDASRLAFIQVLPSEKKSAIDEVWLVVVWAAVENVQAHAGAAEQRRQAKRTVAVPHESPVLERH